LQEGVAVRLRLGDAAGAVHAAGPADILDDHGLPENFPHPLSEQPGDDVVRAARREWIDHGEWPRRPVGCMCGGEAQANGGKQRKATARHISSLWFFLVLAASVS
jgi:hypothetical protein